MEINTDKLLKQLEEIYNSSKPWSVRQQLRAYIDRIYVALEKEI